MTEIQAAMSEQAGAAVFREKEVVLEEAGATVAADKMPHLT